MTITETITERIKDAMRAKDSLRLTVLRGISAAFTNELVNLGKKQEGALTDDEALTVIMREAKKRKDAIEQFTAGGRPELAESEQAELVIIEEFLPAQMSREEVEVAVKAKHAELGITDPNQKGQFIGAVMKDLKGKADGKIVQEIANTLF